MSKNTYTFKSEIVRVVKYDSYHNVIKFPTKVGSFIVADFNAAVFEWLKRRPYDLLMLDFTSAENVYSNGMLPIIATVTDLRQKGYKFKANLPSNHIVRKLFRMRNWAHFLSPEQYEPSEFKHHRHIVTRQFKEYTEIYTIVKDFMDVVLRNVDRLPSDIISGLEWTINEVCDNVINHSESAVGGFVEVSTFPQMGQIGFTVSDAGKGILASLKEGIPTLRTDAQAIGEAIKAGVTRNKKVGQGNGLAGTIRVTTMTGGSMDVISGSGRFIASKDDGRSSDLEKKQHYNGTSVCGSLLLTNSFSVIQALSFGGVTYKPVNIIEMDYEMPDQDCLMLRMKDETTGYGTRPGGRQMKTKLLNLLKSKPGYPLVIDWEGVPVISSSFADEFLGKLFIEFGPMNFVDAIRNKNMEPLVRGLIDKAIMQRLAQSKDD